MNFSFKSGFFKSKQFFNTKSSHNFFQANINKKLTMINFFNLSNKNLFINTRQQSLLIMFQMRQSYNQLRLAIEKESTCLESVMILDSIVVKLSTLMSISMVDIERSLTKTMTGCLRVVSVMAEEDNTSIRCCEALRTANPK